MDWKGSDPMDPWVDGQGSPSFPLSSNIDMYMPQMSFQCMNDSASFWGCNPVIVHPSPHDQMLTLAGVPLADPVLQDMGLGFHSWDEQLAFPCNSPLGSPEYFSTAQHYDTGHGCGNLGLLGDVVCSNQVKPSQSPEANTGLAMPVGVDCGGARTSGAAFRRSRSSSIGYEEISKYFYMNIAEAAKELKVGLTVLKKRCRELGITRWPHRKMKSLSLLIRNVEELGKSGIDGRGGLEKEIDRLVEQQRQMEVMPQLELSDTTKRLRQACFKANYKKRKALEESRHARSFKGFNT